MIKIYTDGACSPDKIGGWGVFIDDNKNTISLSGNAKDTTNNQMELVAFYNALKWISSIIFNEPITIYCDSAYIVNCFCQKWYVKWESNNWLCVDKTPVKNKELWNLILEKWRQINGDSIGTLKNTIVIEKVSSHIGIDGNERADKLAVMAKQLLQKGQ